MTQRHECGHSSQPRGPGAQCLLYRQDRVNSATTWLYLWTLCISDRILQSQYPLVALEILPETHRARSLRYVINPFPALEGYQGGHCSSRAFVATTRPSPYSVIRLLLLGLASTLLCRIQRVSTPLTSFLPPTFHPPSHHRRGSWAAEDSTIHCGNRKLHCLSRYSMQLDPYLDSHAQTRATLAFPRFQSHISCCCEPIASFTTAAS
ncbi:uncharacterized protein CLUP02_09793 [Colletotrichum lupini]|uniref:Uncharacterized protein n=1 Tax=Colletotrichum lupini TaxID=145971 RepID=A0A9Q8SVF3_9PEZI|nr:uncharacterized protein CLUP02_09793 [Colletotrichum lupini]UQC84297.1 hypothetical protein CLUP02_09793 [Colletotrichum lupini]